LLDGTVTESRVRPRRTGLTQLDSLLEITWYSYQIHRIGNGQEPAPKVSPWWVLVKMVWGMVKARF
jgi:hypothetical protein